MLIIISSICVLLLSVCVLLLYKIYKYSLIILDMEEAVEQSIDVLNERIESMEKILQKEGFFDSIEVRQVINDIRLSRDAVLFISSLLIGDKSIDKNSKN